METKKNILPAETNYKDLSGRISINLENHDEFITRISELGNYNPDRFEIAAIRVFIGHETQVTVYAIDKSRQDTMTDTSKLPVHKFKLNADIVEVMQLVKQANFTLCTGDYDLKDMEVINK